MNETPQIERSNKEIKLNLDDFDLENFDIKPLNKGLGFHRAQERVHTQSFNSAKLSKPTSKFSSETVPNPIPTHLRQPVNTSAPAPLARVLADKSQEQVAEKEPVLTEAKAVERLAAFAIDLGIVFIMLLGLAVSFLLALSLPLAPSSLTRFFSTGELTIIGTSFFALLYLGYFSILDMHASFGKDILKLKLVTTKQEELGFSVSLVRTVLSLISFVAMGLPLILDFHSRLSDTKVVKAKSE